MTLPNNEMMGLIRAALNKNQKAIFKVSGESMLPFFKHQKTTVTVQKVEKDLKKGDVILFNVNKNYILHRIIGFKGKNIICQGDHLLSKEVIILEDVMGILTSFEYQGVTTDVNNMRYRIHVKLWRLIKPIAIKLKRR